MEVLFIAPQYKGGIGGHALRVAEKLQENGINVTLMEVPHIPVKKLKNPSFALFSSLRAMTTRKRYDVAHAFNLPSAFALKYVKAKNKVLSIHGVYSEQVRAIHSGTTASAASIAEKSMLKLVDVLTTDSAAVKNTYKKRLGVDFEFLYAPLDTAKFNDVPRGTKVERQVAYIGRDSFEKGIDVLRKAESEIDGKVIYCTNVSWKEAMKALSESEVFVLPSRMESIPQSIKEAFYLKVPVVAANVGGVPELVTHEKTGLLVPPEDPHKLAEAVNQILDDKEFGARLADAGYDFVVNNLTWEVLLPRYLNFYKDLAHS